MSDFPAVYLRETCRQVQECTGTIISESAVCLVLQCSNFSRKALSHIARQRNDKLRE